MYLFYKKKYPLIPNCLTENEISKRFYNQKKIYTQNNPKLYTQVPSDIKQLHNKKDLLSGYSIVNYNQMY